MDFARKTTSRRLTSVYNGNLGDALLVLERTQPENAWSLTPEELNRDCRIDEFQVQFYSLYEQRGRSTLVMKRDSIEGDLGLLETIAACLKTYAQYSLLGRVQVGEWLEAPAPSPDASGLGIRARVRQVVKTLDAAALDAAYEAARQPKPFVDRSWWPQPRVSDSPGRQGSSAGDEMGVSPRADGVKGRSQLKDPVELVVHELALGNRGGEERTFTLLHGDMVDTVSVFEELMTDNLTPTLSLSIREPATNTFLSWAGPFANLSGAQALGLVCILLAGLLAAPWQVPSSVSRHLRSGYAKAMAVKDKLVPSDGPRSGSDKRLPIPELAPDTIQIPRQTVDKVCLDLLRKVGDTSALLTGSGEKSTHHGEPMAFQVVVNVPNGLVVGVSPENPAAVPAWEKLPITRELHGKPPQVTDIRGIENRLTSALKYELRDTEVAVLHLTIDENGASSADAVAWLQVEYDGSLTEIQLEPKGQKHTTFGTDSSQL